LQVVLDLSRREIRRHCQRNLSRAKGSAFFKEAACPPPVRNLGELAPSCVILRRPIWSGPRRKSEVSSDANLAIFFFLKPKPKTIAGHQTKSDQPDSFFATTAPRHTQAACQSAQTLFSLKLNMKHVMA
jgi:hypothetical protein